MQPLRLTIAEMAVAYGVSLRALRFYEERGLLNPLRAGSNRVYSAKDKITLELVLKGKQLGFSLTEIERLLRSDTGNTIVDVADAADLTAHLEPAQIRNQIRTLEEKRDGLERAIAELRQVLLNKA